MNELINSRKKPPEITNRSKLSWDPTSCPMQPYSKPAVNRQPGFRREDSQSLLPRPDLPGFGIKMKFHKKWNFRKIWEITKKHKTYWIFQNFSGPGHFTFLEEMNSRIAHQFAFLLNLVGKIQMIETVKNELNNSKKKAPEIINSSTFFWVPTSWTAQPYSKPVVNRQPGFCREDL